MGNLDMDRRMKSPLLIGPHIAARTAMKQRAIVAILAVAVGGCVHPHEYPGLDYGPACDDARLRVAKDPHTFGFHGAVTTELVLPPMPVPMSVDGDTAVVDLVVDPYGRPKDGTIRVVGVRNAEYRAKIVRAVAATQFSPAHLGGCALEGTAHLTYQLRVVR
jgi:hypothetical protein